jgi:hypothetical protein
MIEQLRVLQDVVSRLDRAGFSYMVTGSLAMNHYAQPRMTRDMDLVVELSVGDAQRVEELFAGDYYLSRDAIRRAIEERRMFNLIHFEEALKVDLIVRKDTPYRRGEFERRRTVEVEGISLRIATPEDLLLSKLVWYSDSRSNQQLQDVKNIIDSVDRLDVGYLRQWAVDLGVAHLLEELLP